MTIESNYEYRVGGSLSPDAPSYVERQTDRQFYDALITGQFCYVLTSRQMGKSSLRIRTRKKLQAAGVMCGTIDLQEIGTHDVTPEQWYAGVISQLTKTCQLTSKFNWRNWWREQYHLLSPLQCLSEFVSEVLLVEITQPLVIFIDEIDSVLSLSFPVDDFFALLKTCYDKRSTQAAYNRLSFALIGVASPSELIRNRLRSPFNIGRAIELRGFELLEATPLAQGLCGKVADPLNFLQEILAWTGGQPFLTQKICQLVADSTQVMMPSGLEPKLLAQIIQREIIDNWYTTDELKHLHTIENRLLRSTHPRTRLLEMYRRILVRGKIPTKSTPEDRALRLSGLVTEQRGQLQVFNRIYQSVFSLDWVDRHLPDRQQLHIRVPLAVGAGVSAMVLGICALGGLESWELASFEYLRARTSLEPVDNRLLIVGADETDLRIYGHPLPDPILTQVVAALDNSQPAAIGIDIIRDRSIAPEWANTPRTLAICAFSQNPAEVVAPPAKVANSQVGFTNLYLDRDLLVRRYLLSHGDEIQPPCNSPYSFAWQLAYRYLATKKIETTTVGDSWKFGNTIFERLTPRIGYRSFDPSGNQILIDYRRTPNPRQITRQITIRDVLNSSENFQPNLVKGQVVIVSMNAPSVRDRYNTPVGELSGSEIHAHVVSQILSTVEDRRPLLWGWQLGAEGLWIGFWAMGGAIGNWYFHRTPRAGWLVTGVLVVIIYGGCHMILVSWSGWIPLVPAVVATVGSAIGVNAARRLQRF